MAKASNNNIRTLRRSEIPSPRVTDDDQGLTPLYDQGSKVEERLEMAIDKIAPY